MAPDDGGPAHFDTGPGGEAAAQGWECGDCGWTLRPESLPPGLSMPDALDTHAQRYCGGRSPD